MRHFCELPKLCHNSGFLQFRASACSDSAEWANRSLGQSPARSAYSFSFDLTQSQDKMGTTGKGSPWAPPPPPQGSKVLGVGLGSNSWLPDPEFGAPWQKASRLGPDHTGTVLGPGRKREGTRPQSHPRPEARAFFTLAFQSYPIGLLKDERLRVLRPGSWIKGTASAQV